MEFAPKTILSLVDLSQATANVLSWTRLFAEKFGSEVQILHVMWPPVPRVVTKEEGEQLLEEFEDRRVELRRAIRAQADEIFANRVKCEIGVGVGHPVKVALDSIGQWRPDLVILGSHGHDGMARSLMGSVAENVVRESVASTLVVKGDEVGREQQTLQRLLCPVDLTKSASESLDASASLACRFEARLDVLRILPEGTADLDGELAALKEWVPQVVRPRCPITETAYTGDTAEQIVLFARQHAVELIVVGTEPRRVLEFTVLGRTTERVVRHGPCSVLLLRMEAE